jgi:hypothetical protein
MSVWSFDPARALVEAAEVVAVAATAMAVANWCCQSEWKGSPI